MKEVEEVREPTKFRRPQKDIRRHHTANPLRWMALQTGANMSKGGFGLVAMAACAILACGHSMSPSPLPSATGYTGEWSGTTRQNQAIEFSVSADQQVTSVTVGWNFSGCSEMGTSSAKSFPITTPQPPGPPPWDNPGFVYGGVTPDGSVWLVTGAFTSTQSATGTVEVVRVPGCGNTIANWDATRH